VRRLVYAILCAAVLAALATYAWRGWYARYITDDYCTAYRLRELGFVEAMRFHRQIWSGRYSYFPIKAGLEAIGSVTARFTPTALMLLLGAAAGFSIRRLAAPASRLPAILGALTVVYAVVDASPSRLNIGGALLWETGAITYLLPLVLMTAWLGLFGTISVIPSVERGIWAGGEALRVATHPGPSLDARDDKSMRRRWILSCAASAGLMFVAGGLSETSLAAQGALTAGALALALLFRSGRSAWIAACGLAATMLGLSIMVTAPGTLVRAGAHTAALPPGAATMRTLEMAYRFIGSHVFVSAAAILPLIAAGIALGTSATRLSIRVTAAAAGLAVAIYVASFVPAAWLVRASAPERTLDIPSYFLLLALFTAALAAGTAMRDRMPAAALTAALLLASIVPLLSIAENLRTMPEAQATARQMDDLERSLRQQRGRPAIVRAKWALGMGILGPEPDFWANQCVSHYYGLQSLTVVE